MSEQSEVDSTAEARKVLLEILIEARRRLQVGAVWEQIEAQSKVIAAASKGLAQVVEAEAKFLEGLKS